MSHTVVVVIVGPRSEWSRHRTTHLYLERFCLWFFSITSCFLRSRQTVLRLQILVQCERAPRPVAESARVRALEPADFAEDGGCGVQGLEHRCEM